MEAKTDPNLKILNATVNMNQTDEDPVLVHSRSHISGSQFLDLRLCRDLASPYPHMMPSAAHFSLIMKMLDVRKNDTVVVYDTAAGWFANRAVFVLRAFGIKNVQVLDGGFKKWTSEGKAVVSCSRGPCTAEDFAFV